MQFGITLGAPRKPSSSPDAFSSSSSKNSARTSESSLDSSLSSRDRKELQDLREELRKESQGRAAAADALAEIMAQQLRESQRVADERRAAERTVAEERQAQLTRQLQESQKLAEERQTQLSLQLRERQKALEERLLAAEEQRAIDQQAAEARKQAESHQLEERLQAAVAAQVQELVLAQASPSGPVESGASIPSPGAETPSSEPHHGLVETASATTCDVRRLSVPTPDVKVQQLHAWDMVSLPVRVCQAIRDRVVEHGSGGVDAQFLFYKVAREYREVGQADEHGPAACRIRDVARATVRTGERVLNSQVVLGFSESWSSEILGGECSRCGCGSAEGSVRFWACQPRRKLASPEALDGGPGGPSDPSGPREPGGSGGGPSGPSDPSGPGEPGGSSGGAGGPGGPGGPSDPGDLSGQGDDADESGSYRSTASLARSHGGSSNRRTEQEALKWALKLISNTVDRYDTTVEGSNHAFGPLIRFVRQVRELLDLEPGLMSGGLAGGAGGAGGMARVLQSSSQQQLPLAVDAQGVPGVPVGQPRLVPTRQRAAAEEA
ncbi:hypothetical protein CYMTET_39360 [Cymbomonas tetramitiformis]|uniref:Uncharacterized protein n=1 Tax=Cymbomonas tetramitiformis TaxID=36881 RepID=A0AAE0F409_9CHLO|nr:hypothetical protein CYMTET_39360 [Cymbomonas tetramitiformis]